jgi:protein farnesyltransferase subunit beta
MGRLQDLDVSRLTEWLSQRQVQFGGFNGRTNKLIDSCYSFWVGAVFNIVNNYFDGKVSYNNHFLYA